MKRLSPSVSADTGDPGRPSAARAIGLGDTPDSDGGTRTELAGELEGGDRRLLCWGGFERMTAAQNKRLSVGGQGTFYADFSAALNSSRIAVSFSRLFNTTCRRHGGRASRGMSNP